ncbi:MAG: MFS transporter, partial [Woeseiaceae bacterium]
MDKTVENNNTDGVGEPLNRRRKVSVRTKLLFASGALQEAVVTAGGITTILFYNQVLGVSPALAGTAYLIVSIIDAVADPIVGTWSDRFHSRWGRRHPFMFVSAFPIAISFYFLYQPIEGLSETGLFFWLIAFFALVRLGQTFYLIPHDALGAELTDDYEERTSIFGYNNVAEMILSMLLAYVLYFLIFPTVEEGSNGLLNEARYIILASTGAVTILFSVLLCTFGTLDQLPYMQKVEVAKKFVIRGYFREIGTLLRNPSYLAACLSLLTFFIGLGIIGIVAAYAYIYVFELSSEQMVWAAVAKTPGVFLALPLLYFLSKRLEKKQIAISTTLVVCVLVPLPYFLMLMGVFPASDSPYYLLVIFGPLFLGYTVFPVSYIVVDSQLADIADEHELQTGERSEGVIFSVRSFGKKSTQGIGGLLAGFGLEIIGFPDNAEEVGVPPEAIDGLLILNGPV